MTLPSLPLRAAQAAGIALALALASCSFTQAPASKRAFLLDPRPPAATAAPADAPVLRVNRFVVAQPFDAKGLVYRIGEQRYELDYYNEFLAFPATMITENTVRHLAAAGLYRSVVPMGSSVDSRIVLEGAVTSLHGDLRGGATGDAAVLAVRFLLAREDAGGAVLYDKLIERRIPVRERSADALVAALDRALEEILQALAADLRALGR